MKTILIYLFLVPLCSLAQNVVSGKVFFENDGQPVMGASVFYDATTIGTVTDENGYFSLKTEHRLNNALVIKYLGYKTVYLNNFTAADSIIKLQESTVQLHEVVLEEDSWSTQKKTRIFLREFLGVDHNCEILNMDDIHLYYRKSDKTLHAYADKPIKILNKRLHYKIEYHLRGFEVKFDDNSGSIHSVQSVYFSGESQFTDQEPHPSIKITQIRDKAFSGSVYHFFRSLYHNGVYENGFELFDSDGFLLTAETIYDQYFQDGIVIANQNIDRLHIKYREEKSFIESIENPFIIDVHGVFYPPKRILIGGAMGKKRVGQMVPSNFVAEYVE